MFALFIGGDATRSRIEQVWSHWEESNQQGLSTVVCPLLLNAEGCHAGLEIEDGMAW